ncbi:hypothetical protein AWB81_06422 [Caballeronia arationis]|uniref:hypothetical protein n=1 Tax=Caballeronia arationis TaxID=1777142 RepID=UPI00074BDAD5|nr:hypothetical protein [Caballeronia arationis]SAL03459.1 hypothetical protein AWB81_06422 [Caballeronia arationis]
MFLLLCAFGAMIALQFTSGIGQWISANQQATQAVSQLQGLAAKIGLAPSLITTRVLVIAFFVALFVLKIAIPFWAPLIPGLYYLYKTGAYLILWKQFWAKAEQVVSEDGPIPDASQAAAAAGVDVSTIQK